MRRRQCLVLPAQAVASVASVAVLPRRNLTTTQPELLAPYFGPDFSFGVSSSAYQIEGAVHEDGRGLGIWDVFCKLPHRISTGETANMACDHYHRSRQDVALIAAAGIRNYRFSVSWPRLFPQDGATVNARGLAFYDRLIADLQAHGIAPWLCLYHWDLPQRLQARGGWANRDTAAAFAQFAGQMGRYFGDRVTHWMVLNEAAVHAMMGYGIGTHAPGQTGQASWLAAMHHLNLGQGLAIQALRAAGVRGRIGTVASCEPIRPSSARAEDVAAATYFDAVWNGAVLEPLYNGRYPALVAQDFAPFCKAGDMADIHQPIDLLGVNYYSRLYIRADAAMPLGVYFGTDHDPVRYTALGWPIAPDGLFDVLMHITDTYDRPEIFISENGYATVNHDDPADHLADRGRITYICDHLSFLQRARAAGAHVSGYFVWTLLDAFEWNAGTKWHFGLIAVDFATQTRTPKDSYFWYAQQIALNQKIPA